MERIDLFKAFYTQKSKYYADQLEKFEQGERLSFNFWAGFFSVTWFIYRKMYKQAIIIFLIILALTIISAVILQLINPYDSSNEVYVKIFFYIFDFVVLGFIGNKLYISKSIKSVESFINEHGLENVDNSLMNKLRAKGGTSIVNALIFEVIMILIQIIAKYAH